MSDSDPYNLSGFAASYRAKKAKADSNDEYAVAVAVVNKLAESIRDALNARIQLLAQQAVEVDAAIERLSEMADSFQESRELQRQDAQTYQDVRERIYQSVNDSEDLEPSSLHVLYTGSKKKKRKSGLTASQETSYRMMDELYALSKSKGARK